MLDNPLVSIILPTYNRAHLLDRAIRSVVQQTYSNFELIIIDDCSTDNTVSILKTFTDPRIIYIKHVYNKGAAAGRNTGINASSGIYLAFQDSDDEWLPEKLAKQVRILALSSVDVGVIYSDMLRQDTSGNWQYHHAPEIRNNNIVNNETAEYQVFGLGIQTTLIRKACFDEIGLFDERLPRFIDLELFIRLSTKYNFIHIKEPLVKYFDSGPRISFNRDALITARSLILSKYKKELKGENRFVAGQYYTIAIDLAVNNQLREGRKYFLKAACHYPVNIKYFSVYIISLMGQSVFRVVGKLLNRVQNLAFRR